MKPVKQPKDNLLVQRKGVTVTLTTNRELSYTPKEYLDLLQNVRGQRVQMETQKADIETNMGKLDEELKKVKKFEKETELLVRNQLHGVLKKVKDSAEYRKQDEKTQRAWLFSRPALQKLAPESLLREMIWVAEVKKE